jgi:Tfp pilus assembly protein PilF/peroxiredoxin
MIKYKILYAQITFFITVFIISFSYTATAQALLQVGSEAPDFSLKDLNGNAISLSQFSQKRAIVLIFWSTWSTKSSKALKRFQEFYEKYKEKEIEVISINADRQLISMEDIQNIDNFIKELKITFPVLVDDGLNVFNKYGVIALPSVVIITEGKISYELPGFPLIGTEDMFDYLSVLVGDAPRKKVDLKYKPKHSAIADTNLAQKFIKKKNFLMAYPLLKKAIESDPRYLLPYIELARLYKMDNKFLEAEEILRKALALEPDNVVIMSELGYYLTLFGKMKEALEILAKAKEKNSFAPSYYYYGYALAKDGRLSDAFKEFDEAISLNPYDITVYKLRAEIYEENNKLKEASSDYKRALELLLNIENGFK